MRRLRNGFRASGAQHSPAAKAGTLASAGTVIVSMQAESFVKIDWRVIVSPLQFRFLLLLGLLKLLLVLAFGNFLLPLHCGLPRPRGEGKTDDADDHSAVQFR